MQCREGGGGGGGARFREEQAKETHVEAVKHLGRVLQERRFRTLKTSSLVRSVKAFVWRCSVEPSS
jgi:hypothetical protein